MGIGYGNITGEGKWGVLELQREMVGLLIRNGRSGSGSKNNMGNGGDGGNDSSSGKKKAVG